jgi:hypothetical protein
MPPVQLDWPVQVPQLTVPPQALTKLPQVRFASVLPPCGPKQTVERDWWQLHWLLMQVSVVGGQAAAHAWPAATQPLTGEDAAPEHTSPVQHPPHTWLQCNEVPVTGAERGPSPTEFTAATE